MLTTEDLRAGKCFLSEGAKPQVLRVRSVSEGLVRYEVLGRKRFTTGETPAVEFLSGVVREVGCDYQPGAGQRIHVA